MLKKCVGDVRRRGGRWEKGGGCEGRGRCKGRVGDVREGVGEVMGRHV